MDRQHLISVLEGYFRRRGDVAAAYLFGSQARGDAGPDSDVDVAVTFGPALDVEAAFWLRVRILNDLEDALKPLPVNVIDVERAPAVLAHSALAEGILVRENDALRRVEVEVARRREYLDFLPRRRRYLEEVLGR